MNVIKQCKYGLTMFNSNDMYVGRSLDKYGEYAEGEIDLFKELIKEGDTVYDVGANIGSHTLAFAEHLTQLKLLTPLEFNLKLENGAEHVLSGFSGIDEDRLIKLNPDELQSLQAQNFLLPLFMVVASQGQMTRLVTLKNQAATAL